MDRWIVTVWGLGDLLEEVMQMRIYEVYAIENNDLSKKELIGVIPERRRNGSWLEAMKLSFLLFGSLIPVGKELTIKEKRI